MEKMDKFSVDPTIHNCSSLVLAVLGGLHARFDHLMNERHLIMESISDLMFKMIWAEENSKAEYTLLLKGAV